ncbi:AMP-binding protein [Paramicrobacterium sp. CJ85]|uniref:AMP-binding protein n=1 Tax=Paramicrobacterium sp. CJ85 TaxID=3445355 RepID=UPI003F5E4653
MPFTRAILETSASDPDRVALSGDGETYSYRELHAACTLIRSGVEDILGGQDAVARGHTADETGGIPIVAISMSRAVDVARFVCGLNGFRVIVAVLDPLWPEAHRSETIRRVDPALVITDDASFEESLRALDSWSGIVTSRAAFDTRAASAPPSAGPEVRPRDELFLLLFTSGTTDMPKGFLRSRASWDHNVEVSRRSLGADEGLATIAPGPVSYSLTLYALVEVIATAGSLYVQSGFDAIAAADTIARESVQRFVGVPSMLVAVVRAARRRNLPLDSLTTVITGGANQSQQIRDEFEAAVPRSKLRSYYGASEIGFIGYSDSGDGTLLTPFDGVEAQVRGDDGSPLPDGEIGTLFIRVESAVGGYVSSTSTERITGNDGWSTVNDQASLNDGRIVLAGRAGDIAVSGGHKVSLPQVERALSTVPGCEVCCAIALADAALGSVIAAVIEGDEVPAKSAIQHELRQKLAPQFVPHRYYRADRLPRTAGGKVRRVEVVDLVDAGQAERL